jgi:hypothetical protein
MRTEDAYGIPSAGPAQRQYLRTRAEHSNWLYVMLAAASLTAVSSIAGVLVYDWYFNSVVDGLGYTLRPLADGFHQITGDRLRPTPVQPAQ